jgi:DNA-binding NarL/FixJ family response regulator
VSIDPDATAAAGDGDRPDHTSGADLAPEQRALLERLAQGETIAAAAQAEFLSLRTAHRRIARARQSLGVPTTREAVLLYLRTRREGQ